MRREFLVFWAAVVMGHAQAPNVSGEWIAAAGGRYTLIENIGQRIAIVPGTASSPQGYGWLERAGTGGSLQGEVVIGGCWCQFSLTESADGSSLAGSIRIDMKRSTRRCRGVLSKEAKKGGATPFVLTRRP
jgi:hypothetical protein